MKKIVDDFFFSVQTLPANQVNKHAYLRSNAHVTPRIFMVNACL